MNTCSVCLNESSALTSYCACRGTCGLLCKSCGIKCIKKMGPKCRTCNTFYEGVDLPKTRTAEEKDKWVGSIAILLTLPTIFFLGVFHETIIQTSWLWFLHVVCNFLSRAFQWKSMDLREMLVLQINLPCIFVVIALFAFPMRESATWVFKAIQKPHKITKYGERIVLYYFFAHFFPILFLIFTSDFEFQKIK